MHDEILYQKQIELIKALKVPEGYYLAGGTAIALHIGHRKSIDFDFFKNEQVDLDNIYKTIKNLDIQSTLVSNKDQLTLIANGVKVTFLYYPFEMRAHKEYGRFKIAVILDLAASKAFTLGKRNKWKDYVDLYFLIKKFGIEKIITRSKEIYSSLFNDKLFREQLAYFKDIDFTEEVEYIDQALTKEEVMQFLVKKALSN